MIRQQKRVNFRGKRQKTSIVDLICIMCVFLVSETNQIYLLLTNVGLSFLSWASTKCGRTASCDFSTDRKQSFLSAEI